MTDEQMRQFREKTIQKALTTCKHFNGIQHNACEAGVTYPTDGKMALPCLPKMKDKREPWQCGKFEVMTREEAEREADEFERAYQMAVVGRGAAKEHAKNLGLGRGKGGVGELKCPCCDDGFIRYSVAGLNGHMHAACTTGGCVRWME